MPTMSLKEAYSLAHSAECRLAMEANRPERNLRYVVGHLMHYENLRLRIVEMEHDISKSQRAKSVAFKGTGHVGQSGLRKQPSTGQLGRRKSPPPQPTHHEDVINDDDDWSGSDEGEEDDQGDDLGLQRFPSGSAKPPQPPPDLMPDLDDMDDYDDEPESPEEPDEETLERLLQSQGSTEMANTYNGVKKCKPNFFTQAEYAADMTRSLSQASGCADV